jgi:hypothetical protein
MQQPGNQSSANRGRVIVTSDTQRLRDIVAPDVLAVILEPRSRPTWVRELAAVVTTQKFVMPRTILDDVSIDEIASCVTTQLSRAVLSSDVSAALCRDLMHLVDSCANLTGSTRFRFRFFTDVPNCRCSYHVDVVPPNVPTTALVRVYCGACTEYVVPSNLKSWEDFYSYVFLRKQHLNAITDAQARCDLAAEERATAWLLRLDEQPPFLIQSDAREHVPPDSTVVCKFVDSRYLWGGTHVRSNAARGWIHRSPMFGDPRFVATINAAA